MSEERRASALRDASASATHWECIDAACEVPIPRRASF